MDIDKVTKTLKSNSLRVTSTRIAVANILIKNSNFYLTAEDIFDEINKSKGIKCDQVSVYRILATFEELEIVKKSDFNNDASRYCINNSFESKSHTHEHYFKCIKCLTIEAFSECFILKKEKELEKNGYRQLSHHIEITGLCPACA